MCVCGYGDVIEELDAYVGELVDLLKRKGLYDQTVIVVSGSFCQQPDIAKPNSITWNPILLDRTECNQPRCHRKWNMATFSMNDL